MSHDSADARGAKKRNGKGACIVDERGNVLGSIVEGDSFVTMGVDSN